MNNEKKQALISAVKYVYVGIIYTLTYIYSFSKINIYVIPLFLLLTIISASYAYYLRMKGFGNDKELKETGEYWQPTIKDATKQDNWLVIFSTIICFSIIF